MARYRSSTGSPEIRRSATEGAEIRSVSARLCAMIEAGSAPHEIAIFVRSDAQIYRARAAAEGAGIQFKVLDELVETTSGYASICTMHLTKGLVFRTVAVMACDDEVIPLHERITSVGDESDLEQVYVSERHLLYVACTRARDHLLISAADPDSEFLQDLLN